MARTSSKIKLSDKCGRCPREQEKVVTLEEAIALAKQAAAQTGPAKKDFEIYIKGDLLASYDFLCDTCLNTVCGYAGAATRQMHKKSSSPQRQSAKKKVAVAPPAPENKPKK